MAQRQPSSTSTLWGRVLLGIGGVLIFALVVVSCLSGVALLTGSNPLKARAPAAATTAPTDTASRPTATLTTSPTDPDWHTYSFPTYGFRLDIPTVL